MQKPSTHTRDTPSSTTSRSAALAQHLELLRVVEILHGAEPLLDRSRARASGTPANGSTAHTAMPWVARRRAMSSNSGRSPPTSGWSTTPARGMPSGRACTAGHVDRVERSTSPARRRRRAHVLRASGPWARESTGDVTSSGRGCCVSATRARPSLIARARASPTPSTLTRSEMLARMIFGSRPKRSITWSAIASGRRGIRARSR